MDDTLKISLPLYEGPLDLLLDLIRRQKIDIYDIPIAKITQQYLDYLHVMQDLNVDGASEFLLIAAQLIYIKSKMLLPPDPDAVEETDEDPRLELVRRLLEYEKFKNAAQMLYQREMVENATWTSAGILDDGTELEPELKVTLFDLVSCFSGILKRSEIRKQLEIDREEYSVEQMMAHIWAQITASAGRRNLSDILLKLGSRRALITAFLATLEMVRLQVIQLRQDRAFGEIYVEASMNHELSESFSPA